MRMLHLKNRTVAAVLGGLLTLPLVTTNAIVANRIEPLFSIIRPGLHTSPFEYGLLAFVLACLPVGAGLALRPLFGAFADRRPGTFVLNGGVGALMLAAFVVLSVTLGSEIYRCDILQLPNCD